MSKANRPVIVYDLDDTLISQKDFAFSGFEAVAKWLERNHRIGGFLPLIQELYIKGYRSTLFDETLEMMGLTFDGTMVRDMVRVYRSHEPKIELLEEAREVLSLFKESHYQAIITDGYAQTQRLKLGAIRMEEYVDNIIVSDELGAENWKPSPLPYQRTMEAFSKNTDFVYIGDNPRKDFVTAKKLGWQTFRIVRPETDHGEEGCDQEHAADHTIYSLMELEGYLALETSSSTSLL